ncbi:MAG: DUF4410 domain-containing protein [Verrucomicrobiaceae bacterium]
MNFLKLSGLALISFFAVSCGTTSSLPKTANESGKKYSKVVVRDFQNQVSDLGVQSKVAIAQKTFADMIVSEVSKTGKFAKVSRSGKVDDQTLLISGAITEYDDGNAALRLMIGFSAGNSNFNSTVQFSDKSGPLGTVNVDKNSWALGGLAAATQTAESFIPGAAKRVAKEATVFAP